MRISDWSSDVCSSDLWLMLRRPDIVPERDMAGMIAAYNESVGGVNSDTSGYHETITLASLMAARAVLAGLPGGASPAGAFAALMESPMADKNGRASCRERSGEDG